MSSNHIVANGDTFYKIFLQAKKKEANITYKMFKFVNNEIKDFANLKVGQTVYIPNYETTATSTSAEPTEGKCGNKFSFNPRGKKASSLQVQFAVNGKKCPPLEAEKTYTNEHDKLQESQQGSLDMTINGKKHTIIKDLSVFKDDIKKHSDIKAELTIVDKDLLAPTIKVKPKNNSSSDDEPDIRYRRTESQEGNMTCISEELGFTKDETIYISEMKTCYTANNTPYDIKDVDDQTQMEVLGNLANNFYVGSVGIPSALAIKDLSSKPNRLILIDHFLNKGWDGKFETMAAKTDTGRLLVLKGYPNAREHLNMTRIKASNAKVGTLGIAVNAAVGQKAALAEATGVFGKGSKFNILFALSFETTKWFLSEKPWQDNFSDLFIGLATTTAKFVAAGVVAVVAAGAVVSIGATAGAVILVAVVGTVVIGFVLDTLDNNLGITQSLKDDWNHVEKKIEKSIKTYNKENPVDPNKFHPSGVPSWLLDKQRGEI